MGKYLSIILTFIFCSGKTFTQEMVVTDAGPGATWQSLGTAEVNFTMDHETIFITGPAEFKALKFGVVDASVRILHIDFVYDTGRPDKVNVNYLIPAGGESRVIDLKTAGRKITRVDFWYESQKFASGKIAKLSLWGIR